MAEGWWVDRQAGRMAFTDYVEHHWSPSRHLEISTRAAYRSNLDRHFLPSFGAYPARGDHPVAGERAGFAQRWTLACPPRSVVKTAHRLHGSLKRALLDRVIACNPCETTDLPKVVARRRRIITPDEVRPAARRRSHSFAGCSCMRQ